MHTKGKSSPHKTADVRSDYERRCLETLETALGRTPIYESWKAIDPGPDHGVNARYRSLPILTKADIRAHFPRGLVPTGLDLDAGLASGEVTFVSTSGTADEALENIWNQQWWDASERASWKLNSVAARVATGMHPEAILASALSVGPRSESEPMARERRMLGRFLFLNEFSTPAKWPEGHERRMLNEISEYQPAVLEANPSLLARLARFAWITGANVFQPPLITLTYEFPSALQLRAIRRVFRSPVASSYGSTEAGYVFMECENGRLHQNTDFCRVDVAPLNDGVENRANIGRILVTTFGNRWFPLVRFDIGDLARITPESGPCPCGRTFGVTLSGIEGRLKSLCVAEDGRLVTHRELDEALACVDGLEQYGLVQEDLKHIRLGLIDEDGQWNRVAQDATDILHDLFGRSIHLAVSKVDVLLPERSGKFLLAKRNFPLGPGFATERTEVLHG
jgi:phenylacetate-coenzyme A ligase PaaK-like adenylate-forming protein